MCCMLRENCQIANWIDIRYQCTDKNKKKQKTVLGIN